ncbi:MAG TPA: hypothetical protein QF572_18880 [Vicinamibacterales bacterium]|jgi:hypothetical protein|nr:hypothetical protein [Vicinamibacterales bacterium]
MTTPCRTWWRNCALKADSEILAIDRMEDRIALIATDASEIRGLISTLELCHHKADRWVTNIIEAIGVGKTGKGLGTRLPGQKHPTESVWQNACVALSAWAEGCPVTAAQLRIGSVSASELLSCLGERSPLKEWQVHRVIEKIRSVIHWPQPCDGPTAQYEWLLLGGDEYELRYRTRCAECYRDHEDFWGRTIRTTIHDTVNGEGAELSLGLAIDMLWPCHWRFVENLRIVLGAIGGRLHSDQPFAACGRNISPLPIRRRMEVVSNTVKVFCGSPGPDQEVDESVLAVLGKPIEVKRWLAVSLDKTIRLQLDPPAEVRAISALAGPDWLRQQASG